MPARHTAGVPVGAHNAPQLRSKCRKLTREFEEVGSPATENIAHAHATTARRVNTSSLAMTLTDSSVRSVHRVRHSDPADINTISARSAHEMSPTVLQALTETSHRAVLCIIVASRSVLYIHFDSPEGSTINTKTLTKNKVNKLN